MGITLYFPFKYEVKMLNLHKAPRCYHNSNATHQYFYYHVVMLLVAKNNNRDLQWQGNIDQLYENTQILRLYYVAQAFQIIYVLDHPSV